MKKKLFSALGLLMLYFGSIAQTNIANYTFTSSVGAFTPLSGATTFTNSWDDITSASIPLGGTFVFGTVSYTSCFINSNGYISFGTTGSSTTDYAPISTLDGLAGVISGFGCDGASSTNVSAAPLISYMNVGSEFVVEFKDHATYGGRASEMVNFQIRLNLTTNQVKIVYGSVTAPAATTYPPQVGLRGNTITWITNVNSLLIGNVPAANTCNWSNAVTSNANSSTLIFSTANNNVVPLNGLTFAWDAPAGTLAPVRTFSPVTGIATTSAVITWTAPTSATQYSVQYRVQGACGWTNFAGNPVSVTTASLTGLTPATVYQARVQSSNGTTNAIWSHIPNAAGTGNGYVAAGTFSTLTNNCTGMPSAGTVPASFSICPNTSVVLTNTSTNTGSGITYQWMQAAAAAGPYTNVTAGSGFTTQVLTTASLTAQTFYQLVVTCTNSSQSATTSVVSVNPNNPVTMCYCNQSLGGSGCSGDNITNVSILGTLFNNNSTCTTTANNGTYSLFNVSPSTTASLSAGASYSISVNTTVSNIESLWIDYNQNGVFDASEHTQITTASTANAATIAVFNVPATASLGLTGMRVRSRGVGNPNGPTDACTNFGSGETEDYFVTIVAGTQCSGAPASTTITASSTSICPNNSVNLGLAGTYTNTGIAYQWQSATSLAGPYTSISGATLTSYTTPSLITTTYYQAVVTCTNGPVSTTMSPIAINVSSVTINSVPYAEGFEGLSVNNQLPNCSWSASNLPTICQTYTATPPPTVYNRIPHTGNMFASFRYGTNSTGDYFYSNAIQLNVGITYSASAFYITDGASGWTEFSLLYGTTQSTTGLVSIASATSATGLTNTTYNQLSNTFTVASSGLYYIAVKAIGNSVPWYLTWDDLTITAPPLCSGAPASNTAVASATTVCSGNSSNLSLATTYTVGGLSYQWFSAPSLTGPYTAVSTATQSAFTATNITANTFYEAVITCVSGPASTTSTPVQVSILGGPVYATVPFLENFDNAWQNRCDIDNVPVAANWDSNPTTGNNSWRRQDDGSTAAWLGATIGTVSPLAGAGCADFHSYEASSGTTGDLNLYVNLNSSSTYTASFYYYNASGTDSMEVFLSTNGGATFTKKAGYTLNSTWNKKTILLPAVSSSSCVIKFTATSDFGNDDIAIDSLQIQSASACSVSIAASSSVICNGSTATLTASGATTYTWNTTANTSSIAVTPSVNTTYTVTGTAGTCTASAVQSVSVNPSPTVSAASSASLICSGQSATITASGASTYTWNTTSTNTAIAVSPTTTTSYTVTGTNIGGCTNVFVISQAVSLCTGINAKTASTLGVLVYPNPNTGEFTVELNNGSAKTIQVMDLTGRIILSNTTSNDKIDFNINSLANGVYFVKVQSNNAVEVIKIVKQ